MSDMFNNNETYNDEYFRSLISSSQTNTAERESRFLVRAYANLTGAVLLFAVLEALIFAFVGSEPILRLLAASPRGVGFGMLGLCILGPMGVNAIIAKSKSRVGHYVALATYVVLYTLIFLPILTIAANFCGTAIIGQAIGLTIALFIALTSAVFMTRADFSFLRSGLVFVGIAAFILIVASLIFGFELGAWFSAVMILFACGYILYDTSNMLQASDVDESCDVLAALNLFGSVMTLFFYILRLLMAFNRR